MNAKINIILAILSIPLSMNASSVIKNTDIYNNYKEDTIKFIGEKYYIPDNMERYATYYQNHDDTFTNIVSIVNVNMDKKTYVDYKNTDMSKNYLILVNKYNKLSNTYAPTDLVALGNYSTWGSIRKEIYNSFVSMITSASKDGYTIRSVSPYRDYETQEWIYNNGVNTKGVDYALRSIAKPGFSEHQTGLAMDLNNKISNYQNFESTSEFTWMQNNAHKYGFILRYPKGKEYLTGFKYESWHYRYVGVDVATKIKELGITFDEYYAYYCEYKNEC